MASKSTYVPDEALQGFATTLQALLRSANRRAQLDPRDLMYALGLLNIFPASTRKELDSESYVAGQRSAMLPPRETGSAFTPDPNPSTLIPVLVMEEPLPISKELLSEVTPKEYDRMLRELDLPDGDREYYLSRARDWLK